ncbi:hypothetical protein [Nesterenkonia pannonica]|uniref:hypothetical protein n=1 Tax=Nesterenkonia pannonica TaxID=1548602 RepID=UPI002164D024|nr:hypothetical protein [Nesterenkonia pannonica]
MAYATYMEGLLSGSRASSHLALATLVFVAAANLRPAISAVGPLLETIGDETGAGPTALGALGALPVFTFALVSPSSTCCLGGGAWTAPCLPP